MDQLRISDNHRYFIKEDGSRFVWLADTVWTMPQRLKWDDADYLMKIRKSQGFTVLQIVALDPERDQQMRTPAGEPALIQGDLNQPNEAYFSYLDQILDRAEAYGFHVLLLPVWGQLVVGDNWGGEIFEKTVTEDKAYAYGEWIGNRYKNRKNILWCLGGDRQPIHKGVDYKNVWRRLAEGLAKGVLNQNLSYNKDHEAWEKLPLTYHACHEMETGKCSTMSYWDDGEAWISFIMLQSGHGLAPKNYELVKKEYDRNSESDVNRNILVRTMPVWDGEPAYEEMPTTWPPSEGGFHGSWMVRKRAYWSLLSGSFGHTYGHASVWCSISEREKNEPGWFSGGSSWLEAIHSEGSRQMKYLRDFMEAVDLAELIPAQEILDAKVETDLNYHKQAAYIISQQLYCVYFPQKDTVTLKFSDKKKKPVQMAWWNPKTGQTFAEEACICSSKGLLTVETPDGEPEQDWILFLGNQVPKVVSGIYLNEANDSTKEAKKVFDWA